MKKKEVIFKKTKILKINCDQTITRDQRNVLVHNFYDLRLINGR
jgi:hypothetical protein